MRHEQEGAEAAAALIHQLLDAVGGVLWRADDGEAGIDHRLHRVVAVGDDGQIGDLAEVVDPLVEAEPDVLQCLLAGLGDMHGTDQAPGVAVHGLAVLDSLFLGDRPVRLQRVEAAGGGGAQREQADAMLARGPRTGGRDLTGHSDLNTWP